MTYANILKTTGYIILASYGANVTIYLLSFGISKIAGWFGTVNR